MKGHFSNEVTSCFVSAVSSKSGKRKKRSNAGKMVVDPNYLSMGYQSPLISGLALVENASELACECALLMNIHYKVSFDDFPFADSQTSGARLGWPRGWQPVAVHPKAFSKGE